MTPLECRTDPDFRQCECRMAVDRAYNGMLASGAPSQVALDVAIRVYRYHHPEFTMAEAQSTVEVWVFSGRTH